MIADSFRRRMPPEAQPINKLLVGGEFVI